MLSRSRAVRRRVVVAGILAVGWAAAIAIYVTAPGSEDQAVLEEMESSREYERQVEVIGGKATLLATQLDRWLAGLWQGQNLAYTVACLTVLVALGYYAWDRVRSPHDPGA